MLDAFIRTLDRTADPYRCQVSVSKSLKDVSKTLGRLSQTIEDWPVLPTTNEDELPVTTIPLRKYAPLYEDFGNALDPPTNLTEPIYQARTQVAEARRIFQVVKSDPEEYSEDRLLEAAQGLKDALQRQREAESEFIQGSLHQWRAALVAMTSRLEQLL